MNTKIKNERGWIGNGLLAGLIFLTGALFGYLLSYTRRLLGQPGITERLLAASPPLTSAIVDQARYINPSTSSAIIDRARYIAAVDVRNGIEERPLPDGRRKQVLNAGWRNFREPWARDFGFASFGLVELNEERTLRETLEMFFHFQTEDGQLPVKVHSTGILERYIHSLFKRQQPIHTPIHPKYTTAHRTISLDGNSLIVIAALNYLRRREDKEFAKTYWEQLKRALQWLEDQALEEDGLLHQGAYTDWADSVERVGAVHYTNVLYWKALHDFAKDASRYGYKMDAINFSQRAARLKERINAEFWRDNLGFYCVSKEFSDILSSDGNLLAVAWGLATSAQANAILDKMEAFGMADPVPTQVTNEQYGRQYIAVENRLAGIGHYHTSAAWLWLGSWHVAALTRANRLTEAKALLERMSRVIVDDGVVHEVYDKNGRYLSTFWYQSEAPLTWSAGMFVYAQALYWRTVDETKML